MDIIDLSNGAEETQVWYVMPYPVVGGVWDAQVDGQRPTWTNDYRRVKTACWYAGTVEDWKKHIAEQTLRALALPTISTYHEASRR